MSAPIRISSKSELIKILRAQAVRLNTTREAIDHVAGFTSGYASKILGRRQVRSGVHQSLFTVLEALGLALFVGVDEEAVQRLRGRYGRQRPFPCNGAECAQLNSELADARD